MFPAPLDEEPFLIAVEYDANGQRRTKTFDDMIEARRFFVVKAGGAAGDHASKDKAS